MSHNSNPFMSEEDAEFLYGKKTDGSASYGSGEASFSDPHWGTDPTDPSSHLTSLQEQKQNSMNRQLESTKSALSSMYDSEAMGVATAEELVQQGEQLDNVERKLDTVNADLKTSQKHLNSIKSIFGGIKTWWNKKDEQAIPEEPPRREPNRHLQEAIERESTRPPGTHPALRLRSDDGSGFYDEADSGAASGGAHGGQQQQQQKSSEQSSYEAQLDENLDEMSVGMSRLKSLAMGLGDEIETQNDQVDRITGKVDNTDERIRDKNAQMRRILGK